MDVTMPSLDREWTEEDWAQFSRYLAEKARRQSKRIPLDEVFARLRCGAAVQARIRRLEPRGPLEGEYLRGWHPHHSFAHRLDLDVIGPKQFIERYGREAYRAAPKSAFIRRGHRKAIKREYVQDFLQETG